MLYLAHTVPQGASSSSDIIGLCAEVSVLPAFSWMRVQMSLHVGGIWGCCFSVLPLKCIPLYGYFRSSFFCVRMYIRQKFQTVTIKFT